MIKNEVFLANLALPIALIASVFTVVLMGEVEGRVPDYRGTHKSAEHNKLMDKKYCSEAIDGFSKELFYCQVNRNSEHTVVVWGDSHALHLTTGISELYAHSNVAIAYKNDCISQSGFQGLVRKLKSENLTQKCVERNKKILEWARQYQGELVIFISNAKRNKPAQIAAINNQHIKMIQSFGHKAFVMGDFIRPGVRLAQCYNVPSYILTDKMLQKRCHLNYRDIKRELGYSKALARLSNNYIPVHESQCPDDLCRFYDDEGRLNYRDHHHMSRTGSIFNVGKAQVLIERQYRR